MKVSLVLEDRREWTSAIFLEIELSLPTGRSIGSRFTVGGNERCKERGQKTARTVRRRREFTRRSLANVVVRAARPLSAPHNWKPISPLHRSSDDSRCVIVFYRVTNENIGHEGRPLVPSSCKFVAIFEARQLDGIQSSSRRCSNTSDLGHQRMTTRIILR
jgi:hypothetical protein